MNEVVLPAGRSRGMKPRWHGEEETEGAAALYSEFRAETNKYRNDPNGVQAILP
jgi:D-Tyr-tRNAtyr deacylase